MIPPALATMLVRLQASADQEVAKVDALATKLLETLRMLDDEPRGDERDEARALAVHGVHGHMLAAFGEGTASMLAALEALRAAAAGHEVTP